MTEEKAKAPKRSEEGVILPILHSLACNPVFGRDVKYRCVQKEMVCAFLLYGCFTWPVRVANERMLEDFNNDSIHRILHVRCRDGVPSVELSRRLCLTSIPALLVQRRLHWFGRAARHPDGELIKHLLLSPFRCATIAITIKTDIYGS